ncbi:DUF4003 family protein [Salisediminibacterium halotolerans]|uniref:DUF4003 family protein n=1 Tax=Salisediminibacterium halotolerans TaxID=517425 RepID=UPI000EB4EBA6|nr:DUF4003 family protein [Salisediminibacterium halotolerans]RLJ75685.1 uncharacterized protein DUF4003 [Actinophytocola xinjiangensis]RPE89539.1 uncharacterized protein DUF4003 [Salisediminibacterium halotolerans]TWG36298.1 uncharacterized protein DUF4003 [Salisediminibacterium halotolerans]GEL09167.1 hypothetical protein SHA02_25830 [Salisediminibacterium halotolerans]
MTVAVEPVLDTYDEVKKLLRWQFPGTGVMLMTASMYELRGEPFDAERFLALADTVKKKGTWFSPLKQSFRFSLAANLATSADDPERALAEVVRLYEALRRYKFKQGTATYVTAMLLHKKADRDTPLEEHAERTQALHRGMKEKHPFLTGETDYPLAAMLAMRGGEPEPVIERIEYFYKGMAEERLQKSNELQMMSHLLSLDDAHDDAEVLANAAAQLEHWKKAKLRLKPVHYPSLAMLALAVGSEDVTAEIKAAEAELKKHKGLRWEQDWPLVHAVQLTIHDWLKDDEALRTTLYTTIETVQEAQQTAMLAAVTAGVVVGGNSG